MKMNKIVKSLVVIALISFINFYSVNAEEVNANKVGGKAWTWMATNLSDYDRCIPSTNETGDTKSANEIGIDYCELLETATPSKQGAFKVEYELPNGTKSNTIYIIPKIEVVQRYSYIYFREEGTQLSLLPDGKLDNQNVYSLKPGNNVTLSWEAKEFKGYEFTRSVISTKSNTGFNEELKGEAGKIRNGNLIYNNSNNFNVIFYYKSLDTKELEQALYVSTDMNGNSIASHAVQTWHSAPSSYEYYNIKEQLLYNGHPTGINIESIGRDKAILIKPATPLSDGSVKVYFTNEDGSNKREATLTIPAMQYKNTTTTLQVSSDKDTYSMSSDKDSIDINIEANAFVEPTSNYFTNEFIFGLTARITNLEINNIEVGNSYKGTFDDQYYGATTTHSFKVTTGLKSLTIKRSQLQEGINTITLNGYSSMSTFNNFRNTIRGSKTFTIIVEKS